MEETELIERLHEIMERCCKVPGRNRLAAHLPPFDYLKPNEHDSKSEFLAEKQMVSDGIEHCEAVFEFVKTGMIAESEHHALAKRLSKQVDTGCREEARVRQRVATATDVARLNAAEAGATFSAAALCLDIAYQLSRRAQELEQQELAFWSGKSRPPNHHARTIALRAARYVARTTGKKPTVGKSSEGNHPSTDFGRAVEEVFALLGIKSDFRRAARWAVKQLRPEDLQPQQNTLAGLLSTPIEDFENRPFNALAQAYSAESKARGE
ncbi:hypothetical protein KUV47_00910 [Vannielia litorea]|uniref:hypothetical protein n=1 Tax=Vannielia litorea TaxID=1217970 RepID=UPI001C967E0D|nr:hypothetical protein [Vannielia litorea]MBY6151756.1 hypothetical protein [Vannielia litorea]